MDQPCHPNRENKSGKGKVLKAQGLKDGIREVRFLLAGNVYWPKPIMATTFKNRHVTREQITTELRQRLIQALPMKEARTCDFAGWTLLSKSKQSLPVLTVIEILALWLQRTLGWQVYYIADGRWQTKKETRPVAIFETRERQTGEAAALAAIAIVDCILADAASESLEETVAQIVKEFHTACNSSVPIPALMAVAEQAEFRGIAWRPLPGQTAIQVGRGRFAEIVRGVDILSSDAVAANGIWRQEIARELLETRRLTIARQKTVFSEAEAVSTARKFGLPVLIGTPNAEVVRAVYIEANSEGAISEAFRVVNEQTHEVLIEQIVPGNRYCLTLVDGELVAASRVSVSHVTGDGVSNLVELVAKQDPIIGEDHPQNTADFTASIASSLSEHGMDPGMVPAQGYLCLMGSVSNAPFCLAIEISEVHPEIRNQAERAAVLLGSKRLEFQIAAYDIGAAADESAPVFCQLDGLSMPEPTDLIGAQANVRPWAEFLPDGRTSIPIIAIQRCSETRKLRKDLVRACRDEGIRAGRVLLNAEERAQCPEDRARSYERKLEASTLDESSDVLILAVSADEMTSFGLGVETADIALVPSHANKRRARLAADALSRRVGGRVVPADTPDAVMKIIESIRPTVQEARSRANDGSNQTAKFSSRGGTGERPVPVLVKERFNPEAKGRNPKVHTVTFVGDIGFGEHYTYHPRSIGLQRILSSSGYDETMIHLRPVLAQADFTLGNLKVPLSDRLDPGLRRHKRYLSWCNPGLTVDALQSAGISAVSLANNHALDCGRDGLFQTVDLLEQAGIASLGGGQDLSSAQQPLIHRFRVGKRERTLVVFGAFAYSDTYDKNYRWYAKPGLAGVNPLDPTQIAETIETLRETLPEPLFVVFPKWGEVYQPVNVAQASAARALISAGADVVIGHGTHAAQPVELIDGKPVVYSLGNFIWNTPGSYAKYGCPGYSMTASLVFPESGEVADYLIRFHPLVTDNMITKFRTRPTFPTEFAEAANLLAASIDYPMSLGVDSCGAYLDLRMD